MIRSFKGYTRISKIMPIIFTPVVAYCMGLPKESNLCSKFRMQYKSKKFEPYKIATYDTERTLKAAAKATDQKLHAEISSFDLIAKEFKVHAHCYQNFTRGFSRALRSSSNECTSSASQEKHPTYDAGNFDKAKEYVSVEVTEFGKAVSMKTPHEMYEFFS